MYSIYQLIGISRIWEMALLGYATDPIFYFVRLTWHDDQQSKKCTVFSSDVPVLKMMQTKL